MGSSSGWSPWQPAMQRKTARSAMLLYSASGRRWRQAEPHRHRSAGRHQLRHGHQLAERRQERLADDAELVGAVGALDVERGAAAVEQADADLDGAGFARP